MQLNFPGPLALGRDMEGSCVPHLPCLAGNSTRSSMPEAWGVLVLSRHGGSAFLHRPLLPQPMASVLGFLCVPCFLLLSSCHLHDA